MLVKFIQPVAGLYLAGMVLFGAEGMHCEVARGSSPKTPSTLMTDLKMKDDALDTFLTCDISLVLSTSANPFLTFFAKGGSL